MREFVIFVQHAIVMNIQKEKVDQKKSQGCRGKEGGKGFEEKYFPSEYPISCLKTNNHLYARKVARMTEQEIDSEIINLEIGKFKKR